MRLVPTRLARLIAVLLPVFLLAAVPAIAQDVPPVLPMLPLSDPILFPGLAMDITIRNPAHVVLIQDVAQGNRLFALVTLAPDPTPNEHGNRVAFPNGTLCRLEGLSRSDGRLVITARFVSARQPLFELKEERVLPVADLNKYVLLTLDKVDGAKP